MKGHVLLVCLMAEVLRLCCVRRFKKGPVLNLLKNKFSSVALSSPFASTDVFEFGDQSA